VARSPEKGAKTLVWLATSSSVANVSGVYFFDQEQTPPSPRRRTRTPRGACGRSASASARSRGQNRVRVCSEKTRSCTGPQPQLSVFYCPSQIFAISFVLTLGERRPPFDSRADVLRPLVGLAQEQESGSTGGEVGGEEDWSR